jgi:Bacterial alpha-L-rhamnosidase 6 hairpin glycosidase domain/Bacterial alpha-L-rhamnosidase C-terminal domain/Alpha-L-rhamnosidase N-terminal domain
MSRGRRGSRLLLLVPVLVVVLVASLFQGATAESAPGRDHPPDAPVRLTVNDRVDPLAIEGVPRFGWLVRDRDRDEVQTAYQIVVRRGGTAVWDSGRITSSRQSWISYVGPSLAPGTTYQWTVRTWDRRGTASPFAEKARFDTGLSDGDWSGAAWIRRETTGNDAADEWTLARKVVQTGRSPVVRARAYVSAPGDWALQVDGTMAGRGSSYGYPGEGFYDVVDLKGIRPGAPLTVGVRYHYWTCRCQGRANGPQPPEGPSGLLVKIVVDHADGSRETAVSDGSWRLTRDTAQDITALTYRNSDAGDRVERHDARQEITGWDTAGFDDTAWTPAVVIGTHPRPNPASCPALCVFARLTAQEAHLAYEVVRPVSVLRLPDGTLFADMGRVVTAVPRIDFRAGTAGRAVTMTTSYRRNNTTLAEPVTAGANVVSLVTTANLHVGDQITVDAPANGYGPGSPETRTVVAVSSTQASLDKPLTRPHAGGAWVENSRSGTSGLDTQGSDLRFHYVQKAGRQTATPFTYWGWRYLEISDPGERLSDGQITALEQATDVRPAEAATFASSDRTLDEVFQLMRRSALLSAQNVFLDTPTREKGQFLGDTIDQSFATMDSLGERSLTRQAILEFAQSQTRFWPNGALNAVYPNGDGKRDIPDYSEMFPEWVMRYHQITGDDSLVAQVLPTMRRVADYIWSAVDSTGLVHQLPGGSGPYLNGIIDWPAAMRYDTVLEDNGSRTVINALAVGAMRAVAAAAAVTGDGTAAGEYGQRAESIAKSMNELLRDPGSGHYVDGLALSTGRQIPNRSQHAQTFPVAYGVAPAASYPGLGAYIGSMGMRQGPMTLRQLLAALGKTGQSDAIVRLLTNPEADGPARVLSEGGTFLWEQWTPGCTLAGCTGTQVNQSSSESFSHGWGAAGISGILESLLGLEVTTPGAATVRVAPPANGLRHAQGTVWTERGPVSISWTRTGKGMTLDVNVPVNVTATVVLPGGRPVTVGSGQSRHHQD